MRVEREKNKYIHRERERERERERDYGAGVGHCALKNWGSHIDASHSRQPLVKGERLVRYEVNAVIGETMGLSSSIT